MLTVLARSARGEDLRNKRGEPSVSIDVFMRSEVSPGDVAKRRNVDGGCGGGGWFLVFGVAARDFEAQPG